MATRCKFPIQPVGALPAFSLDLPPIPVLPVGKLPSFKCVLDIVLGPPPEK